MFFSDAREVREKYQRANTAALKMIELAINYNLTVEETKLAADRLQEFAETTPVSFPTVPLTSPVYETEQHVKSPGAQPGREDVN